MGGGCLSLKAHWLELGFLLEGQESIRDQPKGAGQNELVIGPSVQPKGVYVYFPSAWFSDLKNASSCFASSFDLFFIVGGSNIW